MVNYECFYLVMYLVFFILEKLGIKEAVFVKGPFYTSLSSQVEYCVFIYFCLRWRTGLCYILLRS